MASRKAETPGSVIGTGLKVVGNVRTKEALRVLGLLEGNLVVEGPVEVGRTGRVRGDVVAQGVVVDGRIDGNVQVEDKLDLRLSGRIRGDIVAPRVSMVEGSFFRGRLMTSSAARKAKGSP
jgi:cytoskeletal protein CcmA (bactofilin family)